ncbi:hypothetical protein DE146DRAFT_192539 [Phaeosphaeria sp. MPI-PUGE-AT-0046c]|nr:hypothetical protein DE146DRAFT_192539 [Phaeosphaeria sp. MPI-PUGE-AT-0046c]
MLPSVVPRHCANLNSGTQHALSRRQHAACSAARDGQSGAHMATHQVHIGREVFGRAVVYVRTNAVHERAKCTCHHYGGTHATADERDQRFIRYHIFVWLHVLCTILHSILYVQSAGSLPQVAAFWPAGTGMVHDMLLATMPDYHHIDALRHAGQIYCAVAQGSVHSHRRSIFTSIVPARKSIWRHILEIVVTCATSHNTP